MICMLCWRSQWSLIVRQETTRSWSLSVVLTDTSPGFMNKKLETSPAQMNCREWRTQFSCILRFPALSLVPQSTSETYKYSVDVGDSEETAKGPGHALGHSENNSHSKAEDTADHLQRLMQMTRTRVELFVNDTCFAVWLHLSFCSRDWEKKIMHNRKNKILGGPDEPARPLKGCVFLWFGPGVCRPTLTYFGGATAEGTNPLSELKKDINLWKLETWWTQSNY